MCLIIRKIMRRIKNEKQNLSNEEKVLRNIKYFFIFIILLMLFLIFINKSTNENIEIYPIHDKIRSKLLKNMRKLKIQQYPLHCYINT